MYEVELKVRADHEPVRDALSECDAAFRGAVEQVDTYYDAPHRSFAETDEALRVRRERPLGEDDTASPADQDPDAVVVRLTYKGPKVDASSKTRTEHETTVGDPEAVTGVLEGVGFTPAATVHKRRERYDVDGYTVSLDVVDGLGSFVEVETEVERESDIEAARDGAADLLTALDLDPDRGIRRSYLGLLLDDEDDGT